MGEDDIVRLADDYGRSSKTEKPAAAKPPVKAAVKPKKKAAKAKKPKLKVKVRRKAGAIPSNRRGARRRKTRRR